MLYVGCKKIICAILYAYGINDFPLRLLLIHGTLERGYPPQRILVDT